MFNTSIPRDPTLLSEYELLRILGRGSCGQVYLGKSRINGELAAIKEFPVGDETVQSFYRELSIMFTLNHENIVRCIDLIHGKPAPHYLIYEYADCGSLREYLSLNSSNLKLQQTLEICRQILSGLAHAHTQGIVHRDIKPENVLICSQGTQKVFKITDMGLSTTIREKDPDQANGSPIYMAPEQFYDRSSYHSDLYSMGVLLYEMLTGKWPFEGSPQQLFTAHCQDIPDWEPLKDSPALSLVQDLLSKQAGSRPENANEVIARIDHILDPEQSPKRAARPERETSRIRSYETNLWQRHSLDKPYIVDLATISSLHYSPRSNSDQIWLGDAHGVDCLNLSSLRLTRQVFPNALLGISTGENNNVHLATTEFVYIKDAQNDRWRKYFASPGRVHHYVCDGKAHYFSSKSELIKMDSSGLFGWKKSIPNYYLAPQMIPLPNDAVAISSGPNNPTLHTITADGETHRAIALPGPVIAMTFDSSQEEPYIDLICQGSSKDVPSLRMTFRPNEKAPRSVREIEPGIFAAWFRDGILVTSNHEGNLSLYDHEHHPIHPSFRTEGSPLDCIIEYSSGLFAWLTQSNHQRFLHIAKVPFQQHSTSGIKI